MKAISITAMIFAVAVAFAVGWLTGSHAGYTAGAESEHVRIEGTGTTHLIRRLGFFVFSPPVAGTNQVQKGSRANAIYRPSTG